MAMNTEEEHLFVAYWKRRKRVTMRLAAAKQKNISMDIAMHNLAKIYVEMLSKGHW